MVGVSRGQQGKKRNSLVNDPTGQRNQLQAGTGSPEVSSTYLHEPFVIEGDADGKRIVKED